MGEVLANSHIKNVARYKIFHNASNFDWQFATTQVHFEEFGVDGTNMLKQIFRKSVATACGSG